MHEEDMVLRVMCVASGAEALEELCEVDPRRGFRIRGYVLPRCLWDWYNGRPLWVGHFGGGESNAAGIFWSRSYRRRVVIFEIYNYDGSRRRNYA